MMAALSWGGRNRLFPAFIPDGNPPWHPSLGNGNELKEIKPRILHTSFVERNDTNVQKWTSVAARVRYVYYSCWILMRFRFYTHSEILFENSMDSMASATMGDRRDLPRFITTRPVAEADTKSSRRGHPKFFSTWILKEIIWENHHSNISLWCKMLQSCCVLFHIVLC